MVPEAAFSLECCSSALCLDQLSAKLVNMQSTQCSTSGTFLPCASPKAQSCFHGLRCRPGNLLNATSQRSRYHHQLSAVKESDATHAHDIEQCCPRSSSGAPSSRPQLNGCSERQDSLSSASFFALRDIIVTYQIAELWHPGNAQAAEVLSGSAFELFSQFLVRNQDARLLV